MLKHGVRTTIGKHRKFEFFARSAGGVGARLWQGLLHMLAGFLDLRPRYLFHEGELRRGEAFIFSADHTSVISTRASIRKEGGSDPW